MISRTIKAFTLWEFLRAHALTLKYFFKPKATINAVVTAALVVAV